MKFKNQDILKAISESRKIGQSTCELFETFVLISDSFLKRPNYQHFTYRGDIHSECIFNLEKYWKYFNEANSQNPFAYFLQIIHMCTYNVSQEHKNKGKGKISPLK